MSDLKQLSMRELFDDLSDVENNEVNLWPALSDDVALESLYRLQEEERILREQGRKEYARTPNVFANFNRIAKALDVTPEQALMVFAMKHLDGIVAWVDGYRSQRESVLGRIRDLRVYLAILHAMVEAYDDGYVSEDPEGLE